MEEDEEYDLLDIKKDPKLGKLTREEVREIKYGIYKYTDRKELAKFLGVTASTITHIRTGRTWKDV